MNVGFLQFKPVFGNSAANLNKIEKMSQNIRADLLVLPELSNSGYMFKSKKEVSELSENIPGGPFTQGLINIAKNRNMYIACGLAEKAGGAKCYNSAVLVGPKGYLGKYRKAHLFNDEKIFFKPGNLPFRVFQVKGVKIGMMICFDWIFPEAMRTLSLKGAQVVCHCANLVMPYCQKAMVTRCIENGVFAVTANRTGKEKRGGKSLCFTGGSQVIGNRGELLGSAGKAEQTIKIIAIDPKAALNKNISKRN